MSAEYILLATQIAIGVCLFIYAASGKAIPSTFLVLLLLFAITMFVPACTSLPKDNKDWDGWLACVHEYERWGHSTKNAMKLCTPEKTE